MGERVASRGPRGAMVAALGATGCGESTLTGPPPPGPVPTALEIRGLPEEPLAIGTVVQLTGWATFSDGVARAVDPVWTSSAPEVASVDGRGFVSAHAAGETRISATLGPVSTEAGVAVAPVNPNLYDLSGQVVNANGHPLADVSIVVIEGLSAGRATMTYPNGGFLLRDLEGENTVAAQKDGYAAMTRLVTRASGRLDFTLSGAAPRDSFGGGQWMVGDEVPPGRYVTDPEPYCHWNRRSGFSIGNAAAQVAFVPFESPPDHDFIAGRELRFDSGQEIVDIHPSDAAFRTNAECGEWRPEPLDTGIQERIPPGTWLVGTQIRPGAYRTAARELCYWARVSGFGAGQEDVVEEGLVELDVSEVELTVTIEESDAGFYSNADCGVWIRFDEP